MLTQEKILRALEKAWLVLAIIAIVLGLYKVVQNTNQTNDHLILFLVAALALFMYFLKRMSRRMKSGKKEAPEQNNTTGN